MTQIFSAAQETGETSSQQVSEVILSGAGGDAKATVVGKGDGSPSTGGNASQKENFPMLLGHQLQDQQCFR